MPVPHPLGNASHLADMISIPHKLSPPSLEGVIYRWRLASRMDKAGGVVTIVGIPLSGKTSLAASWTRSAWVTDRAANVLWYQINDADADIAVFFQLVGSAMANRLGDTLSLPTYTAEAFSNFKDFATHWLRLLFAHPARAPIVFIFDDVHRLAPDSPLVVILAELAKVLGQADQLVMTSRSSIPALVVNAARRKGLIRITDLAVDESEFEDFERGTSRPGQLTREAFSAALRRSGNWIAGLPFLPQDNPLTHVARENLPMLLDNLDAADQATLEATAYLQVGSEHDWALLGGDTAVSVLSRVGTATGLVIRLGDMALRKHDVLFQQVESWAVAHVQPEEVSAARAATARLLLRRGEILSGVRLLVAAGVFDEARYTILDQASHLIDRAKNQELQDIIQLLPAAERLQPAIQLWAAYARLPFSPEEASEMLADIRARFAVELSVSEKALAINGEIYGALSSMVVDGRMPPLIEAATDLIGPLIAVEEPMRSRLFIGRIIAVLLGAPTHRGHGTIRDEASLLLPSLTPESQLILGSALVTHLLWWHGDLEAARALHKQLQPHAQLPDAAHLPVMSWYLGALGLAFRDGDEEALRSALTQLISFARRRGLSHRLGPAYWVATQAFAALGNHIEAEKALKQHMVSIATMRQLHEHEDHFLRGAVALGRGDFNDAAAEAGHGWALAGHQGAVQGRRQNAIVLAVALALRGDDAALPAIEELVQAGEQTENNIFLVHGALARAGLSHAKGRWDDFERHWRDLARRGLALGLRSLTSVNVGAVGRMAHHALAHGIDPEGTVRLITLWRLLPPVEEPANAAWPFPVEINCLGPLQLKIDGKVVKIGSGGVRRKTVEILSLIAGSEGRTLAQSTLMDEAWPGADADIAKNRGKVEVHRLRQLVGRDGVIFSNGGFTLNGRLIITDAERLEEAIQIYSDTRRDLLEREAAFDQALKLYRGPLLPGFAAQHIDARRKDLADRFVSSAITFDDTNAQSASPEAKARRDRWRTMRERLLRPSYPK